ncbi:MAG: DNA glycosylase AlkZ-like family protein [Bellilinea sp.]
MAPKIPFPTPQINLTNQQARRFMLRHHNLLPPRSLSGKAGAIEIVKRLGCIQFDPVNVVGWNPDLVLQARLNDYTAPMLDELLYNDRVFWDGFDKVQSIYLTEDWPHFTRRRIHNRENQRFTEEEPQRLQPLLLEKIRENGPLSSVDLEDKTRIGGFWGFPIRVELAALEDLYNMGYIGIHHRVGTRRYFDVVENLLPRELLNASDPHASDEDYRDWHVMRRVGSLGLAHPGAGDRWLGILGAKSDGRTSAMLRLLERGELLSVTVEGVKHQTFVLRACDAALLDDTLQSDLPDPAVTFLAPLDNFLWHRDMLRWIFNFDYTWEVYMPAEKRKFGHYVLPVLYGEQFIARAELLYERKNKALVLRNWWWESGAPAGAGVAAALADGLNHFARYLEVQQFVLQSPAAEDPVLQRSATLVQIG